MSMRMKKVQAMKNIKRKNLKEKRKEMKIVVLKKKKKLKDVLKRLKSIKINLTQNQIQKKI